MDAKKKASFENKLKIIRGELLGDVEKNLKSSKNETRQNVPDISDEALLDYNNELKLNLGQQDWEKLKLVDEAMERIKTGYYGVCKLCDIKIPEARLKIVPFAQHCVACLESIEKDKSQARPNPLF
tara:strand:- start:2986 stop:3363 length:378 start_codon:yes stop_codon:yes gene_type:complete